jgi:26S proteasome non-ATPase regulatory subunit 10
MADTKANSLHIAASNGDLGSVQLFLQNGIRPSVTRIHYCLEKLSNFQSLDEDMRTPIQWASSAGHTEVVAAMIRIESAAINIQDDSGWTALMSATSSGHQPIVELLLANGADANLKNSGGQIALHYHRGLLFLIFPSHFNFLGRENIARALIPFTKKLNVKDKSGSTPLARAAALGQLSVARALIDAKCNINTSDRSG